MFCPMYACVCTCPLVFAALIVSACSHMRRTIALVFTDHDIYKWVCACVLVYTRPAKSLTPSLQANTCRGISTAQQRGREA